MSVETNFEEWLSCFYYSKMEAVNHFIKVSVPNYFRSLPIPKSIDDFASLNCKYYNALQ